MSEIQLYKMLNFNKYKLSRQQYNTIKGQIRKGELLSAYKGINKILNNE